jgi:hypothetical protein
MSFILKHDLYQAIKKDELEVLLESSPNLDNDLPEVIDSVTVEMSSYLRHRYNVALIFIDVWAWNPAEPRDTDEHVVLIADDYDASVEYSLNDLVKDPATLLVYRSESDGNQGNPLSGAEWTEAGTAFKWYKSLADDNDDDPNSVTWELSTDPRDKLLKRQAVDLTLYELHTRIKPRQIPEHRIAKRDDAVKYLSDAANPRKNIYLDLPLVDHGTNRGNDASFGSNDKITHSY